MAAPPRVRPLNSGSAARIRWLVVANGNTSNFGTLPVALNNGVCEDTEYGVTGNGFPQSSQSTITLGAVSLFEITQPNAALPAPQTYTTYSEVIASFFSEAGTGFANGAPIVSPWKLLRVFDFHETVYLDRPSSHSASQCRNTDRAYGTGLAVGECARSIDDPPMRITKQRSPLLL